MNSVLRRSMLSVTGLIFAGGAALGPAVAAQATAAGGPKLLANKPQSSKSDQNERKRERSVKTTYQAQPNFYYCGPAATRIALTAHGYTPSQDEVAERLGTTQAGTDSAEDTTRVLNEITGSKQYETTEIRDSVAKPEQIEQLRTNVIEALDANRPVVANIKGTALDNNGNAHSYVGGHYLTVVAYGDDGDQVKIADPAAPIGEYWMSTERLAHWIAERGYSS